MNILTVQYVIDPADRGNPTLLVSIKIATNNSLVRYVTLLMDKLTVQSVIDPTDGGNSVASANDELVVDTLVVHAFRLGKLQCRKV
jgi:hypothetical protein